MSTPIDRNTISAQLQRIIGRSGCKILPSEGVPHVREDHRLPACLREFYDHCGGVTLFETSAFPCQVVGPRDLRSANQEIVGHDAPTDRSDSWYIVVKGTSSEAISIDLHPDRLGRCYDSFWDRHGVAGSCSVVAVSFLDLLSRLIDGEGRHWYWLEPGFNELGDAYD